MVTYINRSNQTIPMLATKTIFQKELRWNSTRISREDNQMKAVGRRKATGLTTKRLEVSSEIIFLILLLVEFVWRENDAMHSLIDLSSNVNAVQNV